MKYFTFIILLGLQSICAQSYEPLVTKKVFKLDSYTTVSGKTIRDVRVGWESYGTLNSERDNVILICHYFSGNSHAAGRYNKDDTNAGYWDAIIGAGKPIDTDKYYVISVDSLVNLGVHNPDVTTTGPATVNPDNNKPYGLDFPIVTIGDFVRVQKHLLDSLGIDTLHAVAGPSMGALQTYEWASRYPDKVSKIMPVIASGWASANLVGWLNIWSSPITLDSNWNNGDYYHRQPPLDGLATALKIVTMHAQHWEWAAKHFGRTWADESKNPIDRLNNLYQIESELDKASKARAEQSDANHFLYLTKAVQLFVAGHQMRPMDGLKRIKAPTLLIYTDEDMIFPAEEVRDTAAILRAAGVPVTLVELQGSRGHLDGLFKIDQAADDIRKFLAQ